MTERIVGTDEHEGHWYTGEEIVRCRDCACWYRGYCGRHSYEVANEYGDTYTEGLFPMDEDDFCSLGERMDGLEPCEKIPEMKMVQREEIVRCRDCKFRCLNECTRIDEGFKDYWFAIEPNGYCAWGERMEGSE